MRRIRVPSFVGFHIPLSGGSTKGSSANGQVDNPKDTQSNRSVSPSAQPSAKEEQPDLGDDERYADLSSVFSVSQSLLLRETSKSDCVRDVSGDDIVTTKNKRQVCEELLSIDLEQTMASDSVLFSPLPLSFGQKSDITVREIETSTTIDADTVDVDESFVESPKQSAPEKDEEITSYWKRAVAPITFAIPLCLTSEKMIGHKETSCNDDSLACVLSETGADVTEVNPIHQDEIRRAGISAPRKELSSPNQTTRALSVMNILRVLTSFIWEGFGAFGSILASAFGKIVTWMPSKARDVEFQNQNETRFHGDTFHSERSRHKAGEVQSPEQTLQGKKFADDVTLRRREPHLQPLFYSGVHCQPGKEQTDIVGGHIETERTLSVPRTNSFESSRRPSGDKLNRPSETHPTKHSSNGLAELKHHQNTRELPGDTSNPHIIRLSRSTDPAQTRLKDISSGGSAPFLHQSSSDCEQLIQNQDTTVRAKQNSVDDGNVQVLSTRPNIAQQYAPPLHTRRSSEVFHRQRQSKARASRAALEMRHVKESIRRVFSRNRNNQEIRIASPRDPQSTLTILADVLMKEFNCMVAVRRNGDLKLRSEKTFSSKQKLRIRATVHAINRTSSSIVIARSREDEFSVSSEDFDTFIAELQRSFLAFLTPKLR